MGVFIDFMEKLLKVDKNGNAVSDSGYTIMDADNPARAFWAYQLGVNVACERYAALISKCEFKTYIDGKEAKKDNYYVLNVEPNPYQSAAEFRRLLIKHLILSPDHDALIVMRNNNKKTDMYVADEFTKNPVNLLGPTYSNVMINLYGQTVQVTGTLSSKDTIYIKYSNTELASIFAAMQNLYDELIENAKKAGTYRQKYILNIDQQAQGSPNFNEYMQRLLNEQFNAYIKGDNAVIPLYSGMKVEQTSAGADLGQNASIANKSVNAQVDEILAKVGLAFNIPRSVMLGEYEADDLDQMLNFCIDPMAELITEAFNRCWYGENLFSKGTYCRMDTTKARHWDVVTVANTASKAISSGVYSINDLRAVNGDEPLDPEIGDLHFITRNYAVISEYLTEQEAWTLTTNNNSNVPPADDEKGEEQ